MLQCVLPVERHIDGHALVARPAGHRLGQPPVIFREEQRMLSPRPARPG